jgi:hypothetical protein
VGQAPKLCRPIWKRQFEARPDGDGSFYLNDPLLQAIRSQFGIDFRRTLADVVRADAGVRVRADVFPAPLT